MATEQAMRTTLAEAYQWVQDNSPTHGLDGEELDIELKMPADYDNVYTVGFRTFAKYPTLVVAALSLSAVQAAENYAGSGVYQGSIRCELWDRNQNERKLARMVERYTAAMWYVIVASDPIDGAAHVIPDSFDLTTTRSQKDTPHVRGAGIQFDVLLKV